MGLLGPEPATGHRPQGRGLSRDSEASRAGPGHDGCWGEQLAGCQADSLERTVSKPLVLPSPCLVLRQVW